jgi:farnesyl-diphosphate farnesyltransferase
MEMDLRTFPPENSGQIIALKNNDELEHYTYLVAGCVGQFWTRLTRAYTPALKEWDETEMGRLGIGFGKALQYTNVLRDCPRDLRIGRCYLPLDLLAAEQLSPEQLLDCKLFCNSDKPEMALKIRRIQHRLLRQALLH